VPEPPTTRRVVAAFDVDGTLTRSDCVGPFLWRAAGIRVPLALAGRPVTVARALARRDRDGLKEVVCSALRGLDAAALDRLGAEFCRTYMSGRLRDDTTARLRRHRELGHTVILASASLEPYVTPLGELLGADDVVCTRLESASDGRLTGRLRGENCRGPEKARRVAEWLTEAGLTEAELWAYGDSASDDEFLAMADRAVRVDGVRIGPEPG
jgi:phosphatidylglycerophosphatase C